MNWNKTPYSFREWTMLFLIIVLMISMLFVNFATRKTIESYNKPYNECIEKLNAAINGYIPTTTIIDNMTIKPINYTYK